MKLRESGMPDEAYWESLFDVSLILDRLRINSRLRDVVELGCGHGTFSLPVAQRISSSLVTYDIDPSMVERTQQRAVEAGVLNIQCSVRDVFTEGFDVAPDSQDACLLFNILHCEDPVRILKEGSRVIRPGGLIHVIHWRYDPSTPRGPSMDIRPRPEKCCEWASQAGLGPKSPEIIDLPPYHFGIEFQKPV
jgi:SAM-dependent methyltransferase